MVTSATQNSNVDLDDVEAWLTFLHGSSSGYLHICSTLSWSGQTFAANEIARACDYVNWLDQRGAAGIYLRATTLSRRLGPGERGADGDSLSFPGFWADIDIAGPGHKTKKILPPDENAAMEIVSAAGLPEPTYWIHSGGGLYPWWILDAPIEITSPEILERTAAVSARWHELLAATADRLGWSYGPVGDLSRVLRIPGTVNRKTDEPRPCRMLHDLSTGRLYSPAELVGYLDAGEKRVPRPAADRPPAPTIPRQRTADTSTGLRPGEDLANKLSWAEILEPHGYQFDRRHGEEDYWVRPGKNRRDGHSCTTNYRGSDLLYVFSTEMEGFEPDRSYSKFAAWAILNGYGTDFGAAAKALRAQGYGSQRQSATPPQPLQPRQAADGGGGSGEPAVVVHRALDFSDQGNSHRMADMFGDQFRYVGAQREWFRWNGQVWEVDETAAVERAAAAVTESMLDEARRWKESSEGTEGGHDPHEKVCRCLGCKLEKHASASRNDGKIKGMVNRFAALEGIAVTAHHFDQNKHLVTTLNGVLDWRTGSFGPFAPEHMLTRQLNAAYDPEATAPRFEQFLAEVLPSAAMRAYVQRAMGYTLTGLNNQRALFLLHGPSGSGKSQFLTIMELLFGAFGATAEANTFRETRSEATNNLHYLRGKRFVTTSETSEGSRLDEELIKRITGGDAVTTRELYQKNITWRPEFTIWLATNFPPKLNSDDGAIWDRYKPIHFGQQFSKKDGTDIPNLGRMIFEAEASGILNWLLEGVRLFLEHGLGEPEEVTETVAAHKLESDNVAQFLQDAQEEGILERVPGELVRTTLLFQAYDQWCRRQRLHAYGQKRFTNRMRALGFEQVKRSTMHWAGLRLASSTGFFGTMG